MSFSADITHYVKITETSTDSMANKDTNTRHRQAELQGKGVRKISNGSNDNQATQSFVDSLACTSGVDVDLDLQAMADPEMGTVNFGEVNYFELRPDTEASGSTLVLKGGATNPWEGTGLPLAGSGHQATCGAGGRILFESWVDGFTVGGSSKTIKITPGYTGTFTLVIMGDT